MKNLGTDQDLLINTISDAVQPVDSIAKLNIMTEATSNPESGVPQIMLSQTTSGDVKTWNGDRLTINYASGNKAGYFSISEITGSTRQRLNLEILGANNIFHTSVGGTYGNAFVYAEGNKLSKQTHDCNFLNSNYNSFDSSAANAFNFINSNYNDIYAGEVNDTYGSASNISLYNSNYNVFQPIPANWTYTYSNGDKEIKGKKGCFLKNYSLIGSHNNYIKGRTISEDYPENEPNTTFINSCSGLYNFDEQHGSYTVIGNTFGYFNNNKNCNIIGIGEGLLQTDSNSDKILLGFYNQNTTNENEILVVGDGRLNREYVKGLTSATKDWTTNLNKYREVMENISGVGSTAYNSNFYRHNIFTVNKEGYITISDYKVPNNSARYGYKGITAYVDGTTYELPFSEIYHKINGNDSVDIMQETIDSYTKQLENRINSIPKTKFMAFSDPANIEANTQMSAYLNVTPPEGATPCSSLSAKLFNVENVGNNDIIGLSYHSNNRTPAKVIWAYRPPVENSTDQQTLTAEATIYPYCTLQFMYSNRQENDITSFSGFSLIDQDQSTNTNINITVKEVEE